MNPQVPQGGTITFPATDHHFYESNFYDWTITQGRTIPVNAVVVNDNDIGYDSTITANEDGTYTLSVTVPYNAIVNTDYEIEWAAPFGGGAPQSAYFDIVPGLPPFPQNLTVIVEY